MPAANERTKALEEGRTKYFTGKPCKHGHVDERKTDSGQCVACAKEALKKWYQKNKERVAERSREAQRTYRKSPKYRERAARYGRKWFSDPDNKTRVQHWRRLKKYGLSKGEFAVMLLACGSKCQGCGRPFEVKRPSAPVVDHDHETGKVRGLLCDNCNRALGMLGDDPDTLRRLADYLEKSR